MAYVYVRLESGEVIETANPKYWPGAERLTVKEGKATLNAATLERLHKMLKPGDTVYCVLRHVSTSGMSRRIDFYVIKDNEPVYLSNSIAKVLDYKLSNKSGLIVGGCGMDMGFSVVYELGATMWPDGTPQPHGTRNGVPDSSGGYALTSRWL